MILASGYALTQQIMSKNCAFEKIQIIKVKKAHVTTVQAVITSLVFASTTFVVQGRFFEPKAAGGRETVNGRHSLYRIIVSSSLATVSVIALYFMVC